MYQIVQTAEFDSWLKNLRNGMTRRRLAVRLDRAARGNLGDVKHVGDGIYEMREYFGPGWRMYYTIREEILIVMLAGGDKSTQQRDIIKAKKLAETLEG